MPRTGYIDQIGIRVRDLAGGEGVLRRAVPILGLKRWVQPG
jgi:hypothetical protein